MRRNTLKLSFHEPTTWITADPHVDHASIMNFCSRPFGTVEEMNARILENLRVVGEKDTLIIIGDVAWNKADDIASKLPGKRKILVQGNHDKSHIQSLPHWDINCDYIESKFTLENGTRVPVSLFHYPMVSWKSARTSIHLHGHTHGQIPPLATEFGGRMDVGVDVWDFKPVRLRDVIARLEDVRKSGFAVPGDY